MHEFVVASCHLVRDGFEVFAFDGVGQQAADFPLKRRTFSTSACALMRYIGIVGNLGQFGCRGRGLSLGGRGFILQVPVGCRGVGILLPMMRQQGSDGKRIAGSDSAAFANRARTA